jgi:hypothetical protein
MRAGCGVKRRAGKIRGFNKTETERLVTPSREVPCPRGAGFCPVDSPFGSAQGKLGGIMNQVPNEGNVPG